VNDPIAAAFAEAMRPVIREAISEALAELVSGEQAPTLVDRAGLAKALGTSLSTVSRLRADGAPTVMLGDSPRFRVDDVVDWLKARGGTP